MRDSLRQNEKEREGKLVRRETEGERWREWKKLERKIYSVREGARISEEKERD